MLVTHSVAPRRWIADAQVSGDFNVVVNVVVAFGSAQATVITYASPDIGRNRSTRVTRALDARRARNAASEGSGLPGRKRTMTRASELGTVGAATHPCASAIVAAIVANPARRCSPRLI